MKRISLTFISILLTLASIAGDIVVNSATINGNQPAKKNQTITNAFQFTNLAEAIPLGFDPTKITISMRKLSPVLDGEGLPVVTGIPGFTLTYDASKNEMVLTQNATIPEDVSFSISFDAVVTEETAPADALTQGHGINVNIVPGSTVSGNLASNDDVQAFGYTDGVLPVAFGSISASFKGQQLIVGWETLSEKNNKEFLVEASIDGKVFHSIGTVTSASTDGNSDVTLKYSFSKAWEEASSLLGFPVALIVLTISIMAMFLVKKKKVILLPILLFAVTIPIFSCKKDRDSVSYGDRPDVYVRIAQVDKDGATAHSKVVKIIAD